MAQKFANAARAVLATGIGAGDTTITIVSGGSLFPEIASPDFARAVLQDANGIEIVLITAHTASADSFTVTRAQEGTTARTFAAGSVFGIRVTAADMDEAVSVTPAGSQTLTNKTFGDNPTFSGGTANGVAYLNGSKVLTTGSDVVYTGNFGIGTSSPTYKLNVLSGAGSQNIFQAGQSGVSNGHTITSDGTNLTYQWFTSGSEQMRLTSTGLGIGTSSPGVRLHVASSGSEVSRFATSGADMYLRFVNSFDANGYIGYQNAAMTFWTANNLRATLDSSGNLGIGTSSPSQKLTVAGGIASTTGISALAASTAFFDFNGGNARFAAVSGTTGTAAPILFSQYSSNGSVGRDAMTLDSSGNLGVGIVPRNGDGNLQLPVTGTIAYGNGNSTLNAWITTNSYNFTSGSALTIATQPAWPIIFGTNNTERARITSGGQFGMGFSGAFSALANLNILTGGQTGGTQLIRNSSGNPTSGQSFGAYAWKGTDSANTNAAAEAMIEAVAAENHTGSTAATNMLFYTKPSGIGPGSGPTERARISAAGGFMVGTTTDPGAGLISDSVGNVRAIPPSGTRTSSYTLVKADVGDYVQVGSGGSITIPDAVFAEGDVVSVFNNTSGTVTITCSITTAYIGGADADKATMTLAARGVATILFISGTICVVNGNVA